MGELGVKEAMYDAQFTGSNRTVFTGELKMTVIQ